MVSCLDPDCIAPTNAFGKAIGTYVSDYEILESDATKGMRLDVMSLCLDLNGNLKGIQLQLKGPKTAKTLSLNPLGDMGSLSGDSCF